MHANAFEQLFCIGMLFSLCVAMREVQLQLHALKEEDEASMTFLEWRKNNPGIYLGLSHEGRMLLLQWLSAFEKYSATHPFCDLNERREWILSFMDDFPPNTPKSFPSRALPGARLCGGAAVPGLPGTL